MADLGLGRDEFYHALDAQTARMVEGFAQINERLDTLNGRTRKTEIGLGQIQTVCAIRHPSGGEGNRKITERDIKIVAITIAASVTVLTTLWKLLPLIRQII